MYEASVPPTRSGSPSVQVLARASPAGGSISGGTSQDREGAAKAEARRRSLSTPSSAGKADGPAAARAKPTSDHLLCPGLPVQFVGGGRFHQSVTWPDGDHLPIGALGVVASVDPSPRSQWPLSVHFASCFVRLAPGDVAPFDPSSQPQEPTRNQQHLYQQQQQQQQQEHHQEPLPAQRLYQQQQQPQECQLECSQRLYQQQEQEQQQQHRQEYQRWQQPQQHRQQQQQQRHHPPADYGNEPSQQELQQQQQQHHPPTVYGHEPSQHQRQPDQEQQHHHQQQQLRQCPAVDTPFAAAQSASTSPGGESLVGAAPPAHAYGGGAAGPPAVEGLPRGDPCALRLLFHGTPPPSPPKPPVGLPSEDPNLSSAAASAAPFSARGDTVATLAEEMQRQKTVHARQLAEEARRSESLAAENRLLQQDLVTEKKKGETFVAELAQLRGLCQRAKQDAERERAKAADHATHALELEREASRYQAEVFDLQQIASRLREQLLIEQQRHNEKSAEVERHYAERLHRLESNAALSVPPANLPPAMQLEVGMVVKIAEGDCTLIERYTGTDPNFSSRQCWWVRLPDGDEKLRAPGEMMAVVSVPPSITSPRQLHGPLQDSTALRRRHPNTSHHQSQHSRSVHKVYSHGGGPGFINHTSPAPPPPSSSSAGYSAFGETPRELVSSSAK
ncbi:hypothetical protein DIPPA_04225 [Diplonema papillatum]|nr:hypothetical protein DIPPA_04225 [Diplonema papillatum]